MKLWTYEITLLPLVPKCPGGIRLYTVKSRQMSSLCMPCTTSLTHGLPTLQLEKNSRVPSKRQHLILKIFRMSDKTGNKCTNDSFI